MTIKTQVEKTLEDLYEDAKEDKILSPLQADIEALKNKVMHHKKDDLVKFKPEIKQYLEEEIASRYYFQKGRLEATFKDDVDLNQAITTLSDAVLYQKLLTTIGKAEKPFKVLPVGK